MPRLLNPATARSMTWRSRALNRGVAAAAVAGSVLGSGSPSASRGPTWGARGRRAGAARGGGRRARARGGGRGGGRRRGGRLGVLPAGGEGDGEGAESVGEPGGRARLVETVDDLARDPHRLGCASAVDEG